jgi:trans-aconitate 2-methyltransferase
MPWNPRQYLNFGDERLRPALDMLSRIELNDPARIVDLGCGPGNVTALLKERWPQAEITGVDNSPEMLAMAGKISGIEWQLADIAAWRAPHPFNVVFSNATLHWLDAHERLFPRLMRAVSPGGALAVQMPKNFASHSHAIAREVARSGPWHVRLAPLLRDAPVHDPHEYYRMLAPVATNVDIWETEYLHVLEGENPVANWTRGSLLVPLIGALNAKEAREFEDEYRRRIRQTYLPEADGKTLFPFHRIFIVARR